MVLAYLIPFSQGWAQAHVGAVTIIIIAAMGSVSESVMKGFMRLLGTIIGAIIGMTLIALFPQDRILYLVTLSITVTVVLYLLRAFKGDTSIFMLTAMTMMLVFKDGEVDDVFIYGIDRTFITTFAIAVYTFIGVFLWPVNIKDDSEENAAKLSSLQFDLFLKRDEDRKEREELLENLLKHEQHLTNATMDVSTSSMDMQQWHSLIYNYQNINEVLILLANHNKEKYADNFPIYVKNYQQLEKEISLLMQDISNVWEKKQKITIHEPIEPEYQSKMIKILSHLEHASLLTTIQDMLKLHQELRVLAKKLNSLNSSIPTFFEHEDIPKNRHFLWGDIEHLKSSLITFMIFWTATLFWITLNPPGGFLIVVAATGLSVLTTFSPLKPFVLIIIFTFSFIFATLMYVFVLPSLHYSWELGLFIFGYTFISFHLINPKMSVFFSLGMVLMVLQNEMYYDFSFFLLLLLLFYLFLFVLQLFYYIPFSTKPEHLFLTMKNRFFKLSTILLERGRRHDEEKSSLLLNISAKYSDAHLVSTVKKMQLWASKIDLNYFDTIEKNILMEFTKECEKFTYMLRLLYHQDLAMKDNPLTKQLVATYKLPSLSDLLNEYALGKEMQDIDPFWKDKKQTIEKVEESLVQLLSDIDFNTYSEEVISELYENISLRRNVWLAFFSCQEIMGKIDFRILKRSRF